MPKQIRTYRPIARPASTRPSGLGAGEGSRIQQAANTWGRPSSVPNPGSHEATRSGCTCRAIENHFGRGCAESVGGGRSFAITPGCPLHDDQPPRAA